MRSLNSPSSTATSRLESYLAWVRQVEHHSSSISKAVADGKDPGPAFLSLRRLAAKLEDSVRDDSSNTLPGNDNGLSPCDCFNGDATLIVYCSLLSGLPTPSCDVPIPCGVPQKHPLGCCCCRLPTGSCIRHYAPARIFRCAAVPGW